MCPIKQKGGMLTWSIAISIGPCSPLPRLAVGMENESIFIAYESLTDTLEASPRGMPILTSQMSRVAVLLARYCNG